MPLFLLAQAPFRLTVFLTPVIFGLAHAHHAYEFRLQHPRVPPSAVLLRVLFQLAYTTLFGAYATFLFVRAGSLPAVCAVHAFCNCMGLPQVWGRVELDDDDDDGDLDSDPGNGNGNGGGNGNGSGIGAAGRRKRPSILWSVAYYVLLVSGAVLWWRNLWVLSESDNALVPSSAWSSGESA